MFKGFKNKHFTEQKGLCVKMNERQEEILNLLKNKRRVSVAELSKELFVCEMTIRRDLREMEQNKLLKRYHGGAMCLDQENKFPISVRMFFGEEEKKELCRRAEKYLHDDMYIYIDTSSTCMHMIPLVKNYKNIKVITNSVKTLLYAAEHHIPCILTGGDYYETDMCVTGTACERFIQDINVDVAFLSPLAYSDDGLMTDWDEEQTHIRRIIMANAKQTVFLFASSKLHKKYVYTLCSKNDATEVITM